MALQIERRAARGLTARAFVDVQQGTRQCDAARVQHPTRMRNSIRSTALYDRAASSFNRAHRVIVATAVWQPDRRMVRAPLRQNGEWMERCSRLCRDQRPAIQLQHCWRFVACRWPRQPERLRRCDLSAVRRDATPCDCPGRRTSTCSAGPVVCRGRTAAPAPERRGVQPAESRKRHRPYSSGLFCRAQPSAGVVPLVSSRMLPPSLPRGLTTRAFGVPSSSSDSPARERRLQAGLRLEW